MLITNLILLAITVGLAVYQFLKGTLLKAFATIIVAICSSVVAFGYFELLANLLAGYLPSIALWAQTISFALLFIICFAVMQTGVIQLTKGGIDFGLWPERVGRVLCGLFLGFIASGVALTAAAMAPLPNNYPYPRFNATNPNADSPRKVFLNLDGMVTGWFGMLSSSTFSGKQSFAVLHADYLDQIFLNRHAIGSDVPIRTGSVAIEVPKEKAAWYPQQDIRDETGKQISTQGDYRPVIVRVGIKQSALKEAGRFTISQLRLICKLSDDTTSAVRGKGSSVYPIGYMTGPNQAQRKRLNNQIRLQSNDFDNGTKWIDWLFHIPARTTPVLVEFKLNNAIQLSPPVRGDQAPQVIPFTESTSRGEGEKSEGAHPEIRRSGDGRERGSRNQGRPATSTE